VLGSIAAAAVLLALFIRRSARHPAPVIEPHLLRLPAFSTATAANVVFGTAFGAMLLMVTLWCQDVWGWSALRTGLGVAPGPLLVPFFAVGAGPLARRIGPGPVAALGCAIYAAGCVFWRFNLSLVPDYPAHMLPGMLMTGTGVGIVLGVAILVTVLGHPSGGAAALAAFQHATVVIAAVAATAGLASLLLIRSTRTRARAAVTIAENPVAAAAEEPVRSEP
jgi:hypothetical protein